MSKRKFKVGDFVRWKDPAIGDYEPEDMEWVLNRVFEIDYFEDDPRDPDRLVHISEFNGSSEAQAWEHELELIDEKTAYDLCGILPRHQ